MYNKFTYISDFAGGVRMSYQRLGDLLVHVGLLSEEQLGEALGLQKESKQRLGALLIEQGYITEQQLINALEMQLGIEFIDLSRMSIPSEMAQVLSKNIAKKHGIVPVRMERDQLFIAMSDPMNFVALEEAKTATRKRIIPLISTADAVERSIIALYGNEGAARAIEEMRREVRENEFQTNLPATSRVDDDAQSAPTIRLVNSIIERAVTERASDIHMEPSEKELRVRMRIDGVMRNILTVPKDLQQAVTSRLKVMGNMDISERKIPQDGRANVTMKNMDVDLRMSTLPTIFGEKLVIRLLDKNAQLLDKEAIGLAGEDLEKYDRLVQSHSGVVLIVGPTGSGKSSTMYTMIHELNTDAVNIVTLEDPVEYHMDGINQVQINEKTGMTFSGGLRAVLRQDPDIIAVGEIRDGETAQIAMRAAMTGHLVLSTVHTNSAAAALDRLADIGCENYLVAAALRGVVSQRLVRRVCPHCKQSYAPSEAEVGALGLAPEAGQVFYKGSGCHRCFHTGYRGRIGVFEILTVDEGLRNVISDGGSREEMHRQIGCSDFVSLADNCRRLVLAGETSLEEALKTINSADL